MGSRDVISENEINFFMSRGLTKAPRVKEVYLSFSLTDAVSFLLAQTYELMVQ